MRNRPARSHVEQSASARADGLGPRIGDQILKAVGELAIQLYLQPVVVRSSIAGAVEGGGAVPRKWSAGPNLGYRAQPRVRAVFHWPVIANLSSRLPTYPTESAVFDPISRSTVRLYC